MIHDEDTTAREPSRLASIFDTFPPGTPLSLDDLELAMSRDTERRCLAALDRALDRALARVAPDPLRPSPPAACGRGGPLNTTE